jgi:hypothetical protein
VDVTWKGPGLQEGVQRVVRDGRHGDDAAPGIRRGSPETAPHQRGPESQQTKSGEVRMDQTLFPLIREGREIGDIGH